MHGNKMDSPGQQQWQWPDGRQFAWNTLNEMGKTPGDIGEIMQQIYRNRDPNELREPGLKGTATVGHEQGMDLDQKAFEEKQRLDVQMFEQKQQNQEHWEEEQRFEQQRLEQQRLEEQTRNNNQPQDNGQNWQIGMMPFGFVGAMLGFGLTKEAVSTTGEILSPHTQALGDKMMVTGNDGGLLAQARNVLGITGPSTDTMVTGPNRTNEFIPGATPEPNALNAALNPLAPKNGVLPTPGMTPTFG